MDNAFDFDDPFRMQLVGSRSDVRSMLRMDDDLSLAVAVAQVNEDQATKIAATRDPALQPDRLVQIGRTQLTAGMSSKSHVC